MAESAGRAGGTAWLDSAHFLPACLLWCLRTVWFWCVNRSLLLLLERSLAFWWLPWSEDWGGQWGVGWGSKGQEGLGTLVVWVAPGSVPS